MKTEFQIREASLNKKSKEEVYSLFSQICLLKPYVPSESQGRGENPFDYAPKKVFINDILRKEFRNK